MNSRRRQMIATTLAAMTIVGLSGVPAWTDEAEKIVVSSWGGPYEKATLDSILAPFAKEKGIDYQMVSASGQHMAQVEAQTAAGKITWDVIDSLDSPTAALMSARGLLEPIPPSVKKVLQDNSAPGLVTDYGIVLGSIGSVIICNNEKVKACPSNAAEFFDVDKFPGDRAGYSNPYYMLVMALKAVGVVDRAPTDAEVDQAFALIQKIQPSLRTLWNGGEQSMQLMRSGEVSINLIWNRPARKLSEESPGKWTVNWKDAPYGPSYIVVVKGAPNKELAFQYLEYYATHPEAQAKWSDTTSYGVANPKAREYISPETIAWLPESHLDDMIHGNVEWWIKDRDDLVKRWRQIISGG